jgi:hypothetical protein
VRFKPIRSTDPADIGVPGVVVEVSRAEAEAWGVIEDDSMSLADAMESLDIPEDNRPSEWTPGQLGADASRRLDQLLSGMVATVDAGGVIEDHETNFLFTLLPASSRQRHADNLATLAGEKANKRERRVKANQDKFIAECLAMEAQSAQEAGALGYMARVLVQATMPHSAKTGNEFSRSNGRIHVSILAPSEVGLPYGSYPRLLLAWLTTEAVRTKSSTLYLGESLSQFMGNLGLLPTGGRWGTIPRLRDQADRLFKSYVTAYETAQEGERSRSRGGNIMVADEWDLWWDPRSAAEQGTLFQSWVKLTDRFFSQVTDRPVPIDLRAIRVLKKSPLALDLYAWATYRMSYLGHRTEIPWEALQMQFGADYANDPKGRRNFKAKLIDALRKVSTVYPELRAREGENGLLLLPSPSHVRRLK